MRDYRVKFIDVRVKPPGGRKGSARARVCEHKGCDAVGDCKAPKPYAARATPVPGQREPQEDVHWFCQRHAAEYNRSYDFFDGMTEAEIEAFHASAHYGHKRTWRFGAGPAGGAKSAETISANRFSRRSWIFEQDQGKDASASRRRNLTRLQIRALDEMNLPHDSPPEAVRQQYAVLIKRYHPDSNGGDRSMEARLNVVIKAFKALKSAGLA
ncbi:MAG: J domain-containing protein [Hyphomonadaceae bacterium]